MTDIAPSDHGIAGAPPVDQIARSVPPRLGWRIFLAVWTTLVLGLALCWGARLLQLGVFVLREGVRDPFGTVFLAIPALACGALYVLFLLPLTLFVCLGLGRRLPRWYRIGAWTLLGLGLACTAAGIGLIMRPF